MMLVYEENWEEIRNKMRNRDSIQIGTVTDFAKNLNELKMKLDECFTKEIILKIDKSVIEPNVYQELMNMFITAEILKEKCRRDAQQRGINKALELKKKGMGEYGRPNIELPSDFEEQVRRYRKMKLPLEKYRRKTSIKKSTFYKYANLIDKI